jgi:hypothetical protein
MDPVRNSQTPGLVPESPGVRLISGEQGIADEKGVNAGNAGQCIKENVLSLPRREAAEHADAGYSFRSKSFSNALDLCIRCRFEGRCINSIVHEARFRFDATALNERGPRGFRIHDHGVDEPICPPHGHPAVERAEVIGREDVVEIPENRPTGEPGGEGPREQRFL